MCELGDMVRAMATHEARAGRGSPIATLSESDELPNHRGELERDGRDLRRDRPDKALRACPELCGGSAGIAGFSRVAVRKIAGRRRKPPETSCGMSAGWKSPALRWVTHRPPRGSLTKSKPRGAGHTREHAHVGGNVIRDEDPRVALAVIDRVRRSTALQRRRARRRSPASRCTRRRPRLECARGRPASPGR